MVHGNCNHAMTECNIIFRNAKWFKFNDTDGKNKCNSNSDEVCHHYTKQELNNIIDKSVKNAHKISCCHHHKEEEANAINQFKTL
eukprot:3013702-Ditylum_brightwellii.AAC.1